MHIECFSQRLLNPFRGIVNTIRYQSAEAVSTDGLNWDMYVSNEALLRDLVDFGKVQISDLRYGRWSKQQGLKRGPILPSEDFRLMEEMGAVLYEHLLTVHETVPFVFEDSIELWLLNRSGNPLALLASVIDADDIELDIPIQWRAGQLSYQTFQSDSFDEHYSGSDGRLSAGEYLTRYINDCAGDKPSAQWFLRGKDGGGNGLDGINLGKGKRGRVLQVDDFPKHMLSTREHDAEHTEIINDYIDWLAPWLLLLPELTTAARQYFERRCRMRAMEVEKQYIMYPEIINDSMIRSARVEAALRKAQGGTAEQLVVIPPYYIETRT